MAASKGMVEMILRVMNSTQEEKNDILENSDNDMLTQEALNHDRLKNRGEWPESPESESEDKWSYAVFYTGLDRSIEKHPQSLEQALKWRDLTIKANTIRRVCCPYSGSSIATLANVFLVTTCFALGRPMMPQHAVVHFLRTWANVNFDIPLPFREKSRSGLSANLSGEPPRNWVLADAAAKMLPPARGDFGRPKPEITAAGENSTSNLPHTCTSPKFSPVSSKAIGGSLFHQSFPPPLLGPVLERIIENYVRGGYSQEHLMNTYMLIMRHPSVPRVRHAGRHLFDRVGQIITSYISPSFMVEDLLKSLEVDRNVHLSFTFSTMQELLRLPDSEDPGSAPVETMRIVVDLIHSNVQNGYLPPEEALEFFKKRASYDKMPGVDVLQGLAEIFYIPTSCYGLPHSNLSARGGSLKFGEALKIPVKQPQKQERPLRGDTIFPGLQLSDSDPGSLSPEDGVTEDFWGFLMPSNKARELSRKFNLGRMRDHIRSKTPLREARRKGKIMSRRRILQKSDNPSEDASSSKEPIFALPGEDRKTFIKRNPPMKRVRNRRLEREGTPVPEFKANTPTMSVHVEPQASAPDPISPSSHPAAESSPSAQSSQTQESSVPSESNPATEQTDSSSHTTTESSTTSSPSAQSSQTRDSSVSLESNPTTEQIDMEPIGSLDENKTGETTEDTGKGLTDKEREKLACLCPGEAFTSFHPPPISIHHQYNSANLRPTPANVDFSSYFQSPQASSPGANAALNKIFDSYRDDVENKPDVIGIEGAMKYLGDIGVQLDEVACFAIAELLQSPSMGEFTRSGFLAGWKSVNCETLPVQAAYAKTLRKRVIDEPDYFRRVYRYTFPICRLAGQKILPLEIACEQWRLFFTSSNGGITWNSPSTPWLDWWIEYLNEVWKRPINKDLWEQTEVLVRKTKEDENFGWWNAEGAWPGAIDDFVGWVTNRRGGSNAAAEAMEVE